MVLFKVDANDVKHYQSVFNSWGGDCGGLSADKIVTMLRVLLKDRAIPNHQDLRLLACDMIASLDVSGTAISFQAFVDYMASKVNLRDIDFEYTEAFRLFDRDGNGKLDKSELRLIISKLNRDVTEKTIDGMVNAADQDGDGMIDYEEFVKLASARKM